MSIGTRLQANPEAFRQFVADLRASGLRMNGKDSFTFAQSDGGSTTVDGLRFAEAAARLAQRSSGPLHEFLIGEAGESEGHRLYGANLLLRDLGYRDR
jgi:hypothetical protein